MHTSQNDMRALHMFEQSAKLEDRNICSTEKAEDGKPTLHSATTYQIGLIVYYSVCSQMPGWNSNRCSRINKNLVNMHTQRQSNGSLW